MSRPYVIRQGDYLSKLAHHLGVVPDEVWNAPENQSLRELRRDPNILHPGDVLHVPDGPRPGLSLAPGGRNRFRTNVPTVELRLTLKHPDGSAAAREAYRVAGVNPPIEGTTDGDGALSVSIPVDAVSPRLVLEQLQIDLPLRIGHMDPIEERSGVSKRLTHLGFAPGGASATDEQLATAIRDFQEASGLSPTGEIDPATRDALVAAHGS